MRSIISFFVFSLLSLTGCQKEALVVPEQRPFVPAFYVKGDYLDANNLKWRIDFSAGQVVEPRFGNRIQNFSEWESDTYRQVSSGFYGLSSTEPLFQFTFTDSKGVSTGNRVEWTKAETEAFFPVNKEFEAGFGPGMFSIACLVRLSTAPYINATALTSTALSGGKLKITHSEDFQFNALLLNGGTGTFRGKKLFCTFHGSLDIPAELIGPNLYRYERGEIANGEAVIFIRYL